MSRPDSSVVDQALLELLAADVTLRDLLPDGVFFDIAPPNATQFAIISLVDHVDVYHFEHPSWEECGYAIRAIAQDTSGNRVKAAAARIDALMVEESLPTIPGFAVMRIKRRGRLRTTLPDETSDVRWQQRGGTYEIWVQPSDE